VWNGYEPVKTPTKQIPKIKGERDVNQSQHGFNDEVRMTNDETMIDPLVQC
jgi:hypothetical protein